MSITTPDLTTPTGIAAAIKSAEGQKALMAVCDAASPGPLMTKHGETNVHGLRRDVGYVSVIATTGGFSSNACDVDPENAANATFFMVARTALPLALAELARVTGERDRERKERARLKRIVDELNQADPPLAEQVAAEKKAAQTAADAAGGE